ncbi:MAG: serine protease [Maricaulaceae bacterium]
MRSVLFLIATSSLLFSGIATAQIGPSGIGEKLDAREVRELQNALGGIELNLAADSAAPFHDFKALGKDLAIIDRGNKGSLPARITVSEIKISKSGGLAEGKTRIVRGELALLGEHPWIVSLALAGYPAGAAHFCGGSLIDENWVLTAAHCVEDMAAGSIRLHAGSNDLQKGGQLRNVTRIVIHEGWNDRTNENDIALLQVTSPFDFEADHISAINYLETVSDHESQAADGELLSVIGWGHTREGSTQAERLLRKVTVPVIRTETCNKNYSGTILDGMFCSGIGGKDSCQGDSGGPISTLADDPRQVGVVSWGYGCARTNYPGVYTRLADYSSWIDDHVDE